MCTLLAAVCVSKDVPLLIAANRDERLKRPASGPKLWNRPLPFVAPVDEQAGGTWFGINQRGLVVGITNRFLTARDDSKKSRGALVVEALSAESAESLRSSISSLDAAAFNPFHLFYADRQTAHISYSDGNGFHHQSLSPGLHVVTERSFSDQPETRSQKLVTDAAQLDPSRPELWFDLLRQHNDQNPLDGVCIHAPAFDYGTRSSTVLQLHPKLSQTRMWASEGPACQATPIEQRALLSELF